MAIELKRGCGFRKVGGLYLVGPKKGNPCGLLPYNLEVCECCGAGFRHSRGWVWITPLLLLKPELCSTCNNNGTCKVSAPPEGKHGLLWVGNSFYSPREFMKESANLGISRRIKSVPIGFEIGTTWVYLAHVAGGSRIVTHDPETGDLLDGPREEKCPVIFMAFKPTALEMIVTESQSKNIGDMLKLIKRGIKPVVVPDNDPDHQGSVHDRDIVN